MKWQWGVVVGPIAVITVWSTVMALNTQTLVSAAETAVPIAGSSGLIASPTAEVRDTQPAPLTGRLRILERRRMGLTVKNVVRVLQDMKATGQLDQYVESGEGGVKEIDISGLGAAVAEKLASEKPQAWQDIDWDKVLEWLEKILELLIKYLPVIVDLFA